MYYFLSKNRSAAATADVVHRLNLCRKIKSSDNEGMPVVCVNGAKGICVAVTNTGTDTGTGTNIGYENKKGNPMLDGRLTITKELFHEPVPYDVTEKTLDLAIKNGYTVNYYVDHIIYAQSSETLHEQCIQAYMDLTGVNITKISEGDNYSEAKKLGLPSKLLVLTGKEKLDEAVTFFKKELANDATVIRGSPPFFVEILNKTVCKGFGLQRMCQVFDVPLEQTIAFGDGDNDAEFIQMAGLGIAMKNARQNIKDLADDITEFTNAEVRMYEFIPTSFVKTMILKCLNQLK